MSSGKRKKTVDYLFIKNKNATVLRAYLTKCDQKNYVQRNFSA